MALILSGSTGITTSEGTTALADGAIGTNQLANDAVTTAKIASGAVGSSDLASTLDLTGKTVTLPAGTGGKILQAVQAVKTDAVAMGTSGWTDISGITANITPSSTSSRILISCFIGCVSANTNAIIFRIVRNGSAIGIGDASGDRDRVTIRGMREGDTNHNRLSPSFQYIDSPSSTSSITYKIQVKLEDNGTAYINRSQNDANTTNAVGGRSIASLILTEIAG